MLRTGSVRQKVVFWYALSFIAISSLLVLFLYLVEDHLVIDETKENLMTITDQAASDVSFSDGGPVVDDGISYYMDRTWMVLLTDSGEVFSGSYPEGMAGEAAIPPLENGKIREWKIGGETWFFYDRLMTGGDGGRLWIRGIAEGSLRVISPPAYAIFCLFFLILPILLVISIACGWYITKRAFAPFHHIADTVRNIQEGEDLSLRLTMSKRQPFGTHSGGADRQDEVERTAELFDQMLERIEESFERERAFTDNASHELRTPTAVILAESEYALKCLQEEPSVSRRDPSAQQAHLYSGQSGYADTGRSKEQAAVKKSLEIILAQAGRMNELLSRLLFLARADARRQTLNLETVDISLIAEEAAAAALPAAAEKNIRVEVDAPEGTYMSGDELLLGQMFSNLIANGIRYGKENGTIWIRVCEEKAGAGEAGTSRIRIEVEDDGIGIEEDKLPHIWERFYRADHSRKDSFGLGLPIVRWIVHSHGGTIRAESRAGEGTCFTILIAADQLS